MDNPSEITQPEASEEVAAVSEVSVDVDTPTFTPETTIETVMVVEEAEAVEAAAVEVIEAASSSEGSRPYSTPSSTSEGSSPDLTASNEELSLHEDQIAFQGNDINAPGDVMERAIPWGESQADTEGSTEIREVRVSQDLPKDDHPSSEISGELAPGSEEIAAESDDELPDIVLEDEGIETIEPEDILVNGLGDKSVTTGHGVFSKARELPVQDGSPGEESSEKEEEGTNKSSIESGREIAIDPSKVLEDLSITSVVGDSNESDESSGDPLPPLDTGQGEGVAPMHIDPQREDQVASQQAAAIRGGTSDQRQKKSEFGERLGSFAKGVAQVGQSVAGSSVPGGSILSDALSSASGDEPSDPISADEDAEELDFTAFRAVVQAVQPRLSPYESGEEGEFGDELNSIDQHMQHAGDPVESSELPNLNDMLLGYGLIEYSAIVRGAAPGGGVNIYGISSGKKVTVLAGADIMKGGGAAPNQAKITNTSEITPEVETELPITPAGTDDVDKGESGHHQDGMVARLQYQDSRTKTSSGITFADIAAQGLSKAADAVMSAGQLAAPYIPGGSVLSAAISGSGETSSGSIQGTEEWSPSSVDGGSSIAEESRDESDQSSEEQGSDHSTGSVDEDTQPSTDGGATSVYGEDIVPTEIKDETLGELIINHPQTDIYALIQWVMQESYLEQMEDLEFYAKKVKSFNALKKQIREYVNDLRAYQSIAATTLRDQFYTQSASEEVTLSYSTLVQDTEGEYQLREQSEKMPREEADGLITALEERPIGEIEQLGIEIDGVITVTPQPLEEINDELIPAEIHETLPESDESSDSNTEMVKHYMEMKNHLQNEIAGLKDELMDWPGNQSQTISYSDIEKQSDGKYKKVEHTQVFSKEEVKVLIDVLMQKLAALTKDIQLQILSLQGAKKESDSRTETLGKTAEIQSATSEEIAKKPK